MRRFGEDIGRGTDVDEKLRELLERAKGHVMTPAEIAAQRESLARAMKEPSDSDLSQEELASRRAEADKLPDDLRWKGDGPAPASWYAGDTKVYRSYADYVDD